MRPDKKFLEAINKLLDDPKVKKISGNYEVDDAGDPVIHISVTKFKK